MDVDDENTEPSESFKKEVKEYFKEQALKNPSDRTTRQITDGKIQTVCIVEPVFQAEQYSAQYTTHCKTAVNLILDNSHILL